MPSEAFLQGQHAVVTGAGQGIGAAIAHTLAAAGARLTLMGRTLDSLQSLAAALPGSGHHAVVMDVSQEAQVASAFAKARQLQGAVHILVNNAGQADSAPFAKTSLQLWQRMLDVNLTGTFLCTQAALPDMVSAKSGRIVNIASTAGLKGYAYVTAYTAAKHGVVGLTKALALEVATLGITVNAVCPGYTDTELLRSSVAKVVAKSGRSEQDVRASLEAISPQHRFVQPTEVAEVVRWLCQPASLAITGQALSVSGGEVM
jgi:NAD(P)-dependent dehydrogenase (short-subunit alcohol dehydrogenase family)